MTSQSSEKQNPQYFQPDRLTCMAITVKMCTEGERLCIAVAPPTMLAHIDMGLNSL